VKVNAVRASAITIITIFILASTSSPFNVVDLVDAGKYGDITPTAYELQLLDKINENRTDSGVGPLSVNASLLWAARAHSQDMIDYDFFDHASSEEGQFNGATFKERVNNYAEYESGYVGECIAWKSWGIDVEWTMNSWKNSPSHWNIIIDPNFKEIGIGLLSGEWDGYSNAGLHTVDFGGHATSTDLSINEIDIGFQPTSPYEGEDVNISIVINNQGTTDAYPVKAEFYVGDPESGGTSIGTASASHILIHGEDAMLNLMWNTAGYEGDHDIYVVVDPDNDITESDEGNNVVFKSISVNVMNPPLSLNFGWNLISFPYEVSEKGVENVLDSISGKYDRVQAYDPIGTDSSWLNYNVFKPQKTNSLEDLDNKIGFWIHITDIGGASLEITGDSPSSPWSIDLKEGWNLVGYPSNTERQRGDALNNLYYGTDIEIIQWFDSMNGTYHNLDAGENMKPGIGYFIRANHDCEWIVNP
jgi:uncharacterized protein YkwD